MRSTRSLLPLFATLALIASLFIGAPVAQMASVTNDLCSGNNGQEVTTYTYDDQTLLISTLTITNNGPFGSETISVLNSSGQVVWTRTKSFNTGTTAFDISGLGLHMVPFTSPKNGTTGLILPAQVSCGWSSV